MSFYNRSIVGHGNTLSRKNLMHPTRNNSFRHDLGNGLVLRWSTAEDTERIATFHSLVDREHADAPPNAHSIRQIRELMTGDHPVMGPEDFGIIEDTSREGYPVVASTCLWKHTWTYEGIPFGVGRPEAVATDPAYRHRGLIRALFEMVHARSEAEGDLVQAITGIAYFYRQFGYEYALELEEQRSTPLVLIPKAADDELGRYTFREATVDDIPMIEELYKRRQKNSIVSDHPTRRQWLYEIETWKKHPELKRSSIFQMILDTKGQTVGFVACDAHRRSRVLSVWLLEFVAGVNMQRAVPSVLSALHAYGLSIKPIYPETPTFQEINFSLGTTHPVHELLGEALDRPTEPPYPWYIRVKNLPAFLMHIAPALEQRLAASPVVGLSQEIKLNFYRGGLRMVFERGRLVGAEDWQTPAYGSAANGAFPPLVFLQILFGHRTIEALRHILPDVWVSDEIRPALKALFPTRPSFVFAWY
jgi:GNAT superfamily N-acetyltransferase